MKLQQLIESVTVRRVLWAIGGIIILTGVFKAGEMVGFAKASFSYQWGESYYRSFMGPARGWFGMMGGDRRGGGFLAGHGVSGPILRVASSTFIIHDRDGAEKAVAITPTTLIRKYRDAVAFSDLKPGMNVAVIGAPGAGGVIEARLVRILVKFPLNASTSKSLY